MNVTVLLFASYAEAYGRSSVELDLKPGSTVRTLVDQLRAGRGILPPQPLVAVNEQYADPDRVIKSGDEVAIIPPVAGG